MSTLKVEREQLNNRIERLSVLALAAGDSRNPIVQQVTPFYIPSDQDHCGIGVGVIHAVRLLRDFGEKSGKSEEREKRRS